MIRWLKSFTKFDELLSRLVVRNMELQVSAEDGLRARGRVDIFTFIGLLGSKRLPICLQHFLHKFQLAFIKRHAYTGSLPKHTGNKKCFQFNHRNGFISNATHKHESNTEAKNTLVFTTSRVRSK